MLVGFATNLAERLELIDDASETAAAEERDLGKLRHTQAAVADRQLVGEPRTRLACPGGGAAHRAFKSVYSLPVHPNAKFGGATGGGWATGRVGEI